MGDGADLALEQMMNMDEESEWYEDMILKPCGPGPCPDCGEDTVRTVGRYGAFWGCVRYPKCMGSRNV